MGQYYMVLNADKKQLFRPSAIGSSLKLLGILSDRKAMNALFLLLANSNGRGSGDASDHPLIGTWAGDRIVVQGDYAEDGDPGFIPMGSDEDEEQYPGFTDISDRVVEMLDAANG